jgi:hypothetical protein
MVLGNSRNSQKWPLSLGVRHKDKARRVAGLR